MSIACALALASFGHSLLVLAPGSAVPCHVTVTVWPTVVGTVTWSWAAVNAGKPPAMRAQRTATDPTTASRRATTCPPRPQSPSLRDERFQTFWKPGPGDAVWARSWSMAPTGKWRGWVRTSDLSRVKRGEEGADSGVNPVDKPDSGDGG